MKLGTLELASMALNSKISEMGKRGYPDGSSGAALTKSYQAALYEINEKIGERNDV